MDITGTTAKEASSTISGSFNSMKAAASDFLGNLALGNNIKGPLTNLVTTTGTFLFGNLLPAIGNVFRVLPSVLATIFNEVGPKIGSSLINGLKTAGSAIVSDQKPEYVSLNRDKASQDQLPIHSQSGWHLSPLAPVILLLGKNVGKIMQKSEEGAYGAVLPSFALGKIAVANYIYNT